MISLPNKTNKTKKKNRQEKIQNIIIAMIDVAIGPKTGKKKFYL